MLIKNSLAFSVMNCLVAGLICMTLDASPAFASEQVALVKAVGESLSINENPVSNALANAERKAVKKAAARFIPPSGEPQSIYQEIVDDYARYIAGKTAVVTRKKQNGKLLLFCNVNVDFGSLEKDIRAKIAMQQQKHGDDAATFCVRVTGLPSAYAEASKEIPGRVLNDFGLAFSQYGIAVESADSVTPLDKGQVYDQYREAVYKHIKENTFITYAVVGEIVLQPLIKTSVGCYVEAECRAEVVKPDVTGNAFIFIGSFQDKFSANAISGEEALKIITKKASVNAAKYLADLTYNYWQKTK